MYDLVLNYGIPGHKSNYDLFVIADIVHTLPSNSTIVEIGPSFGITTWHLAKNSINSIVYAVDTWRGEPTTNFGKNFRHRKENQYNSIDEFKKYTSDCDNIVPIIGSSPNGIEWKYGLIDLVIIDITGNPKWDHFDIEENIAFWINYLKPNGTMMGYNWVKEFIPLENQYFNLYMKPVIKYANEHNKKIVTPGETCWWKYE